jgi:hypothetical protein
MLIPVAAARHSLCRVDGVRLSGLITLLSACWGISTDNLPSVN